METKRKDVYEIVTEKIIEEMERGIVPWHKPWLSGGALPKNFVSKKAYRGINVWLLCLEGKLNPYWVTFKQCKDLGGKVKKGAKGTLVIFWRWLERTEEKNGKIELKRIPLLRYFIIFNCFFHHISIYFSVMSAFSFLSRFCNIFSPKNKRNCQ